MTVRELIEKLQKMNPDEKVYREGGEHKDDYRHVQTVKKFRAWGDSGVLIE